jgi:hypothetical protein
MFNFWISKNKKAHLKYHEQLTKYIESISRSDANMSVIMDLVKQTTDLFSLYVKNNELMFMYLQKTNQVDAYNQFLKENNFCVKCPKPDSVKKIKK